jgi:hypothetical protein
MRIYLNSINKLSDLLVIESQMISHRDCYNDCGSYQIIDDIDPNQTKTITRFTYVTAKKTINDILIEKKDLVE